MKVTLRKANALQAAINAAAASIKLNAKIEINEFQDPEAEIKRAALDWDEQSERLDALYEALYAIRASVGEANATSGINATLNQLAKQERAISRLTAVVDAPIRLDAKVLAGKLDKISKKVDSSDFYARDDSVVTGIFDVVENGEFRGELAKAKRDKQDLQDKLLGLNVGTEITLDTDTIDVLTGEGII